MPYFSIKPVYVFFETGVCVFSQYRGAVEGNRMCSNKIGEQYTRLHFRVGSARTWPASPRGQLPKEQSSEWGRNGTLVEPSDNGGRLQTTVNAFRQRGPFRQRYTRSYNGERFQTGHGRGAQCVVVQGLTHFRVRKFAHPEMCNLLSHSLLCSTGVPVYTFYVVSVSAVTS